MICVDQTFLVDLWRTRDLFDSPVRDVLTTHASERFVVPALAAGAFLDCAAAVSDERRRQASAVLDLYRVGEINAGTAQQYAALLADLRRGSALGQRSKIDLWIAAWAMQHDALLVTRDKRLFRDIPGLRVFSYLTD